MIQLRKALRLYHLKGYSLELRLEENNMDNLMSLRSWDRLVSIKQDSDPHAAHHADPVHSRDSPFTVFQAIIGLSYEETTLSIISEVK